MYEMSCVHHLSWLSLTQLVEYSKEDNFISEKIGMLYCTL